MSAEFASGVLSPLVRGTNLTREQAREALAAILAGAIEPAQIASFLTSLTIKGETIDEMTGFIDAMMDAAIRTQVGDDCVDIVGTGGDQLHSVNISTMAAFAVAGTGTPVAKHGNRSATSSVGSADVLTDEGVDGVEVPVALGDVEPVAHDEGVRDLEADVADVLGDLHGTFLHQQRADLD